MHAQHVHISVQLLTSLLHFIITSVSVLMVSAVQIQMMDCLNEGWSLYSFPAQNGECFKNVRNRSHSLDDQAHGCPILSQPEGTECA